MILVGIFSSDVDAGYFRLAFSVAISVGAPITVFHQVLAPTVAQLTANQDRARLQRLLRTSAVMIFGVTASELLMIWFFGKPIISLIFGSAYVDAWVPLVLLIIAQLVNGFFGVAWLVLAMGGGERLLTVSFLTSVTVSVVSAVALGELWGMPGIAAAAIIGALVQNLLAWSFVRKRYSIEGSLLAVLSSKHPTRS
jgi:O-antigen/teichoic acid export membrane protein